MVCVFADVPFFDPSVGVFGAIFVSSGGFGMAELCVFCVVFGTSSVCVGLSGCVPSGCVKMLQEAPFWRPAGILGASLGGPESGSGGETSRHQGRFRTVFYISKRVVCEFRGWFGCDSRCWMFFAYVRSVLFFTYQDAPLGGFAGVFVRPLEA